MTTYYITVNVIKNGKGYEGARVYRYNGPEQKTDKQGKTTIETTNSTVTIFVNGSTVYNGSTSSCPNPLNVNI